MGIPETTMAAQQYQFETIAVEWLAEHVLSVMLNRPTKSNAMNSTFWGECLACFRAIKDDADVRAVVVTGAGKNFTAGLDVTDPGNPMDTSIEDVGRRAYMVHEHVLEIQESFNSIEDCGKPVIIAVHGACYGGGIDMMCASDIRMCTKDTRFSIKEVDVGLAADVGTLQRLPKIVGNESKVRELAYTARMFTADEAHKLGMVGDVYDTQADMNKAALALAACIASKSPLAVSGTKLNLNYARDHTVRDGLNYVATWNAAMLQSRDLFDSMKASLSKGKVKPEYLPLGGVGSRSKL